jgi:hypothetical protein
VLKDGFKRVVTALRNNTIKRDIVRPQYSRMTDMFCGLKIAINDTWGHRIKIIDHFGLDYDDIQKFGTTELVLEKLPNFMEKEITIDGQL